MRRHLDSYSEGRLKIKPRTQAIESPATHRTAGATSKINTGKAAFTTITIAAQIFAFFRITPRFCQSIIGGLRVGWVINQRCSLSDPRAKKNALNNKNGVVGKMGVTTPMIPTIRLNIPQNMNTHLTSSLHGSDRCRGVGQGRLRDWRGSERKLWCCRPTEPTSS